MEIALYLNHVIQLGRILISTLPFVSIYKSHLYLSVVCPLFPTCSTLHNLLYQQFHSKPKEILKPSEERQMEMRLIPKKTNDKLQHLVMCNVREQCSYKCLINERSAVATIQVSCLIDSYMLMSKSMQTFPHS